MNMQSRLKAEASLWQSSQRLPEGPANKDHFLISEEGGSWTIHVRPAEGLHTTIRGLTAGEANRKRMELSDEGFIGKVVSKGL